MNLSKYGINIPGVVWGFLLLAVGWILQANYPNEVWLPVVIVAIGAILKYIEVSTGTDLPDLNMPEGVESSIARSQPKKNKTIEFLLG